MFEHQEFKNFSTSNVEFLVSPNIMGNHSIFPLKRPKNATKFASANIQKYFSLICILPVDLSSLVILWVHL